MNSKRRLMTAMVVLAAVVLGGGAAADEGIFIGYGFAEGYQQAYKVKFNQEVDFGGFAFSQIIDMEVTERCVGVKEELFLMEMTFDKVESARMQFDDMVEDPMGGRLTGQMVEFKVDKFGEVSEMSPSGFIEGWDQMKKVVESIVDNWYAYLPNENVAPGGSWSKAEPPKEESGLTFEGNADYKFKEIKKEKNRECAWIEARSTNKLSGKQETQVGTMDVAGGGKGESEFFFCTESATVIKYKAKVEMKMDMTPEGGGDATETTILIAMEREVM